VNSDEHDLIARVFACDDREAFGELVRQHQSAVRGFLRQLTRGDNAWADDLAQETFLQAYRGIARFRGGSAFRTWLLGIAHNQFRNARRRQRELPQENMPDAIDESVAPPTRQTELRHDLTAALRQLSGDEQTALHVCYQQGLTHEEAADVLSWPLGTVKTHVARAKEKLRTLLAVWNPQS
jgi:RNA polymerase sigma factor (sigma-70 family)